MIFVLYGLCCLVLTEGLASEVKISGQKPSCREEILNYLQSSSETYRESKENRIKKSVLNPSDEFYRSSEVVKKESSQNITALEDKANSSNVEGIVQDYSIFRNYLNSPVQPTTYRYPKAIWSSLAYEKFRNKHLQKSAFKKSQQILYNGGRRENLMLEKGQRRNRGKVKWKGSESEISKIGRSYFVDKFLEQSLSNYLSSSKLKETLGNVSVKTFSNVLKSVTDQKSKKPQSPYDENKELRMKFREEVILKKKNIVDANNETKPQEKFLEKQLQKRLEKVQDMFNERDKDKILANMWKYTNLNRTTETSEETKKNKMGVELSVEEVRTTTVSSESSVGSIETDFVFAITPKVSIVTSKPYRGNVRYTDKNRYTSTIENGYYLKDAERGSRKNSLILTAEESSYYRHGRFPSLTFIGKPEKPGLIPGTPLIDYPMYSFPPITKFKCPKFSDGRPKMMADKETRCQVFYVCTGAGPTTPMLCPNGTMFNENFLVCDWWYNVNC